MPADNKVAIVTGSTRGIGLSVASDLAQKGVSVCIHGTREAEVGTIASRLSSECNVDCIGVASDIASEEGVLAIFQAIDASFGRLDYLVNSAGITERLPLEEMTYAQLERMFKINTFAPIIACREAICRMKQAGGSIVNISSSITLLGGLNQVSYAASKGALDVAIRSIAREAAQYNIRVNGVNPSMVETDMQKNLSEERREHIQKSLPFGRMATPEEVAKLVLWLLSDEAAYVSGANINITGAR